MFKRTMISTISFVFIVTSWYFGIIYPPRNVAKNFLKSLHDRDRALLAKNVAISEYEIYEDLYLRNGFNKNLKKYSKLKKLNSEPFPLPTRVLYKMEVEEDDQFFGFRKQKYKMLLNKFDTGWRVIKFSSEHDAEDLKLLRGMKYTTDVTGTSKKDISKEEAHKAAKK